MVFILLYSHVTSSLMDSNEYLGKFIGICRLKGIKTFEFVVNARGYTVFDLVLLLLLVSIYLAHDIHSQ